MSFFEAFGKIKESNLASGAVQKLAAHLRAYITEHYYPCTPQTLKGLGAMYAAGGEFTENIDKTGGFCGKGHGDLLRISVLSLRLYQKIESKRTRLQKLRRRVLFLEFYPSASEAGAVSCCGTGVKVR